MARPKRSELASPEVQEFRKRLAAGLNQIDSEGRKVGDAEFGVYGFYDFDGEPIYVGQTNEKLRGRVRRHLTNQRTDAVAMRVLDIFEVAEMELWPLWELQGLGKKAAKPRLDQVEYCAYRHAVERSRYGAILNEKIPRQTPLEPLPTSYRTTLVELNPGDERRHPDVRIARRAETISRLAAVVRERGDVSDGLRRVLAIQAVRLTYLAGTRYAESQGEPMLDPAAISASAQLGPLRSPPAGEVDEEDIEAEELAEAPPRRS